MQRLNAAAGAEVERPAHRFADGQLCERGRGRADPEHVVGADPVGAPVETGGQVADDPEIAVPGGVRADVEERAHLADGVLEDALRGQLVQQPGQRPLGIGDRHRRLEQEQPDQRLDGAAPGRTPQPGHRLVAGQRVVGLRAEHLGHPVVGEPGAGQRVAEAGGEVGRRHASTLGATASRGAGAGRWLNACPCASSPCSWSPPPVSSPPPAAAPAPRPRPRPGCRPGEGQAGPRGDHLRQEHEEPVEQPDHLEGLPGQAAPRAGRLAGRSGFGGPHTRDTCARGKGWLPNGRATASCSTTTTGGSTSRAGRSSSATRPAPTGRRGPSCSSTPRPATGTGSARTPGATRSAGGSGRRTTTTAPAAASRCRPKDMLQLTRRYHQYFRAGERYPDRVHVRVRS